VVIIGLGDIVTQVVDERVRVTERVRETVTLRVRGCVVGMAVIEVVMQGEGLSVRVTERVRETVRLRVKGCVVGTPLTDRVMLTEIV
jgi:hypothetical protein